MRRLLAIVLAAGIAVAAAAADEHDVTITADPNTVTIGDVFQIIVQFTLPGDREAVVPGEDADFGPAEVRSVDQTVATLPDGRRRYTVTYSLALWEVGETTLKTPAIAAKAPDGTVTELEHAEATVTVRSVLAEGASELRDIRGPRAMPLRWYHYALAALPVLALIVAVVLLVRRLRSRRRGEEPEEAPAPPLPPAEEALAALDQLERHDLVGQGNIKEHYVRLSWILRNYIERRWQLPALEATTGMLGHTMAGSGRVADEAIDQIIALLRRADLAKFARHRPEAPVAREDIDRAREVVQSTRRREEVAEDAEPDAAVASAAG